MILESRYQIKLNECGVTRRSHARKTIDIFLRAGRAGYAIEKRGECQHHI